MKSKHAVLLAIFSLLLSVSAFTAYRLLDGMNSEVIVSDAQAKGEAAGKVSLPNDTGSNPSVETRHVPKTVEVIVSSAGDCTLGTDDKFSKTLSLPGVLQSKNNDYSYLFKNVAHIFKNDDITAVNLETTLTDSNTKRADRQFNFKGSPELAKALTLGHIEAVNLSNNHIYDYNQQGFNDTIKSLKENKINYFGEGHIWVTTIKGYKFGFLGYTGWSNDSKFLQNLKKDIQSLKNQGCTVIINFHWGEESQYVPNNVQKYIAHFAIDNGADLIIGHHPHVIQGIEKYKDKFICYSLANFCFGGNSNPPDYDTFILQAKFIFSENRLSATGIKVIPCSVSSISGRNDYCPTPLDGDAKKNFMVKLNKYSSAFGLRLGDDFYFDDLK